MSVGATFNNDNASDSIDDNHKIMKLTMKITAIVTLMIVGIMKTIMIMIMI